VFVLPFLAATHPRAARAMLEYRIRRLPVACAEARREGSAGAHFPWESAVSGIEVAPTRGRDRLGRFTGIRTGQFEEHIVADIAWAACCYADWTGDEAFLRGAGRGLILETARWWAGRIEHDDAGRAHIRGDPIPAGRGELDMTVVLAAIDNSAAAGPVLATSKAVAQLLDATPVAVHAHEDGDATARAAAAAAGIELEITSPPVPAALAAAAVRRDALALVVGARGTPGGRRPAGRTALELATSLDRPLVVVPPLERQPERIGRILVPLDGTPATAAVLRETLEVARRAPVEVVLLHVHDDETLPAFEDQPHHELDAWSTEFIARWCAENGGATQVEVRVGVPGRRVIETAADLEVDLIALGWSRSLAGGRAAVVREALTSSTVPVLLLPVATPTRPPRSQSMPDGLLRETPYGISTDPRSGPPRMRALPASTSVGPMPLEDPVVRGRTRHQSSAAAVRRPAAIACPERGATMDGELVVPEGATGLVVFAHSSGSSRHSLRNQRVAASLNRTRLATLLLDLLTPREQFDRRAGREIERAARRLRAADAWAAQQPELGAMPIGYFGAGRGAGVALWAAADAADTVSAVVSRGGRPDLAAPRLADVRASVLLIAGGRDVELVDLNRQALLQLRGRAQLSIFPRATQRFEEPGTLDDVVRLAADWFTRHLGDGRLSVA
jgi:nucleotide-binding universal stress UspA family protein/dienelactone hydrolase